MTMLMKTWGGASPPTPPSKTTFIPAAGGPRTPCKIPLTRPQNPQTHFHHYGNGGLLQLGLAQLGFAQVGIAQIFGTQIILVDIS